MEADIADMFGKTSNMSRGGPTLTGYYDDEAWCVSLSVPLPSSLCVSLCGYGYMCIA